jgi:hypothetical protein
MRQQQLPEETNRFLVASDQAVKNYLIFSGKKTTKIYLIFSGQPLGANHKK